MKKLAFISLSIFVLYSCNKEEKTADKLSEFTKEVIKSSPQKLRHGYSLMTIEERETLWLTKLNAVIENDASLLSLAQMDIVVEIRDFLVDHGMDSLLSNPTIGQSFVETNLSYWEEKFSKYQLFLIIQHPYYVENFSLFADYTSLIYDGAGSSGGKPNCDCRYSIGCGASKTCNSGVLYDCNTVSGCGLFGTSDCTGICA